MWGKYAIGIMPEVYNRKARKAFTALRQYEQNDAKLTSVSVNKLTSPTESILPVESNRAKIWRYAKMSFALMGIAFFLFCFYAVLSKLSG